MSLFLSARRALAPISQSLTFASPSVSGLHAAYDNNNNNNTRTRPGARASTVNQRLGRGITRFVIAAARPLIVGRRSASAAARLIEPIVPRTRDTAATFPE